jgi:hypothetical protein
MNTIEKCYMEVVNGNRYDYEKASEHNGKMIAEKVIAKDMPSIEARFVSENHAGCCLHYGMTLFKMLREHDIECYIAITLEENPITHKKTDNHVSVCYLKDGKKYIADPVEAVKAGGKRMYFDIPIEYYALTQGTIWLYDPYGEYENELFFEGFLKYPIETFKGD